MLFNDLVFRPHRDGQPGHLHAIHIFSDGRTISVTRWDSPYHGSDADRPYEAMLPDGALLEYQTASDIEQHLAPIQRIAPTDSPFSSVLENQRSPFDGWETQPLKRIV